MPKTKAILLATGMKAAMIRLSRWFETPDAALNTATASLAARANRPNQRAALTIDVDGAAAS